MSQHALCVFKGLTRDVGSMLKELVGVAYRRGLREGYASCMDLSDDHYQEHMAEWLEHVRAVTVSTARHDDGLAFIATLPDTYRDPLSEA